VNNESPIVCMCQECNRRHAITRLQEKVDKLSAENERLLEMVFDIDSKYKKSLHDSYYEAQRVFDLKSLLQEARRAIKHVHNFVPLTGVVWNECEEVLKHINAVLRDE